MTAPSTDRLRGLEHRIEVLEDLLSNGPAATTTAGASGSAEAPQASKEQDPASGKPAGGATAGPASRVTATRPRKPERRSTKAAPRSVAKKTLKGTRAKGQRRSKASASRRPVKPKQPAGATGTAPSKASPVKKHILIHELPDPRGRLQPRATQLRPGEPAPAQEDRTPALPDDISESQSTPTSALQGIEESPDTASVVFTALPNQTDQDPMKPETTTDMETSSTPQVLDAPFEPTPDPAPPGWTGPVETPDARGEPPSSTRIIHELPDPRGGSAYEIDAGVEWAPAADTPSGGTARGDDPTEPAPRPTRTVLVIDDDAVMRGLLQMGLGSHGYSCLTAENGKAAQAVLESHRPDLILIDLLMPVMDGLTFIRWLRETARNDTPVLVFTNVDTPRITREALETGANAFACKPLHLSELLEELNRLVPG